MYAIVEIGGQQFKVQKDRFLYTNRLEGKEGDALLFTEVLLVGTDANTSVGQPFVGGASVKAKILAHVRGEKVLVFKKKRRKSYQTLNGHRQSLTKILIEEIVG